VRRVMIMGIGITCLEHSSGPVNCTAAKTMLAYSSSSPRTRTRVDWRYFDSCRVELFESKPSNCKAPDASIGAFLHAVSMEISWQSTLNTNTGPSSVANCGLIIVFDIRHPNRSIATVFRAEMKALIARRDSRDENPHSNKTEALLARRKRFEGPKPLFE
jgi:hypothetical protein